MSGSTAQPDLRKHRFLQKNMKKSYVTNIRLDVANILSGRILAMVVENPKLS